MKFKKLDEYTVRCVLSENDMIENDIEIEDFFSDREKIHNLMEVIIDKAKDEVGYQISDEILSMQVMPLPQNGLAITISGKKDIEMDSLLSDIKNFAEILEDANEEAEDDSDDISGFMETLDNLGLFDVGQQVNKTSRNAIDDSKTTEETVKKSDVTDKKTDDLEKKQTPKDGIRVYRFKTMREVEEYCQTMNYPKYITSHLYKDNTDKKYYLIIEQGRLKTETFKRACERTIEFADLISSQASKKVFINEHYEQLISQNAISTMRKIASI